MVLLLFVFLILPLELWAKSAQQLNSEGDDFYKRKQYEDAVASFEQAIKQDTSFALGHYKLAATLGVLRKQGKSCEMNASRQKIMNHLKIAVSLDPKRGERMKQDADLDHVRDTFEYQHLLGLRVEKPDQFKQILNSVKWYSVQSGTVGPLSSIGFSADGKVKYQEFTLGDESAPRRVDYFQVVLAV